MCHTKILQRYKGNENANDSKIAGEIWIAHRLNEVTCLDSIDYNQINYSLDQNPGGTLP